MRYLADHSTEEEPCELRKHEKSRREDIIPHRSRFVQHAQDDVCHDKEICNSAAKEMKCR
jgi:hypothetical protein